MPGRQCIRLIEALSVTCRTGTNPPLEGIGPNLRDRLQRAVRMKNYC
ncbi:MULTISPECIES: hypothetical protein [Prosthecochloris]|nr:MULTISPECIES: hypothetical protein [Prosthecochloris]